MSEENEPYNPPKNFIAESIEGKTDPLLEGFSPSMPISPPAAAAAAAAAARAAEEEAAEAAAAAAAAAQAARPAGQEPQSAVSNVMGNFFLFLILVCLVSIPFLVYFTDTGSRAKREIRNAMYALGASSSGAGSPGKAELEAAENRIRELEKQMEVMRTHAVLRATPVSPAPGQATPAPTNGTGAKAVPATRAVPAAAKASDQDAGADIEKVPVTLPRREYDVARLFNGVGVRTTLDLRQGDTATRERVMDEAYEYEVKLKVSVPKANQSIAELAALNPNLPNILPKLGALVETSKVSPFFKKLYDLKHERIKSYMTRLDRLETRHNYFDCETVLELTAPASGRKALLMQGEMDVVADGSDGDRMPTIDDYISLSSYYQPATSYGWPKKTRTPNPLLSSMQKSLNEVEEEYKIKGLSVERNRYLVNRRDELRRIIADLKVRSYLVAEADPFIVLPLSMLRQQGKVSHAPAIGDYAAVVHGSTIYPVICGDAGPSWKMGEASLLLAKTINGKASPYNRPVSDLKVTYIIFPGSKAPKNSAPDLSTWTAKCQTLLDEMGGLGEEFSLHPWRDIVAERRAVRESRDLGGLASAQVKIAESAVATGQAALKKLTDRAQAAEKKLADASKATPAPTAEALAALKAQSENAVKSAKQATAMIEEIRQALRQVQDHTAKVDAKAKAIAAAAQKPYPEPRSETTEVALAELADARKLLDEMAVKAQGATGMAGRVASLGGS